jgi:hypothetical protein
MLESLFDQGIGGQQAAGQTGDEERTLQAFYFIMPVVASAAAIASEFRYAYRTASASGWSGSTGKG